jgi:Zn-finger nucleic acid-binding protein
MPYPQQTGGEMSSDPVRGVCPKCGGVLLNMGRVVTDVGTSRAFDELQWKCMSEACENVETEQRWRRDGHFGKWPESKFSD